MNRNVTTKNKANQQYLINPLIFIDHFQMFFCSHIYIFWTPDQNFIVINKTHIMIGNVCVISKSLMKKYVFHVPCSFVYYQTNVCTRYAVYWYEILNLRDLMCGWVWRFLILLSRDTLFCITRVVFNDN